MIRRPPRSTLDRSSAASDVYKRQDLYQGVRGLAVKILNRVERTDAYLEKLLDNELKTCLLYTSPSPRDRTRSRMPSSA